MISGTAMPAQKACEALWDKLYHFRSEHPRVQIDHQGVRWEYITGGAARQVLLILPGAFRCAESAFDTISLFEETYRIIIPTYPPVLTVEAMTDGLIHILSVEGASTASVLGQSYGGWMAQLLVRRHPERFSKLVLSSTGPLTVTPSERCLLPLVLKILPIIPIGFLKKQLAKGFRSELSHFPLPVRPFWEAYSTELFARLSKADIISHFQVAKDAVDHGYMFDVGEKSSWEGELLIVGSDNDVFVTGRDRERISEIYPQTKVEIISDAGHVVAISAPEKFSAAVCKFLSQ